MKTLFKISLAFAFLSCFSMRSSAQVIELDYTNQGETSECCTNSSLRGKTINILGDSYVRNHKRPADEAWHSLVAKKHGMKVRNYGRNGSSVAFDRTREGFGPAMTERYKEMNDTADYVLVIAGHNDADKCHTNPDSLAMFRAGLEELCNGLIAKYPSARIAFVTPWRVPRAGFDEVVDIMVDVCGKHSIPIYNAASNSGIYVWEPAFRKKYFQDPHDTAHLNAAGHLLFMPRAEAFMLSL